jgi:hypothetical protein
MAMARWVVRCLVLGLLGGVEGRGRRKTASASRSGNQRGAQHTAPLPTTPLLGGDIDLGQFDVARDGSGPTAYELGGQQQAAPEVMFTPGNGALFEQPLHLERCAGDWRCLKRTQRRGEASSSSPGDDDWHWRVQSRGNQTAFCDFAVVSADELTAEIFERKFRDKQPLLIRRAAGPDSKEPFLNQAVLDLLARRGLMDAFAPHPASVGNSLEIVHQSGSGGHDMNIGQFVQAFMHGGARGRRRHYRGEPLYIFQRNVVGDDLLQPSIPGLFSPEQQHVNIWMVGPPLSGTAFHFHAAAWTGLIYGRACAHPAAAALRRHDGPLLRLCISAPPTGGGGGAQPAAVNVEST